MRFFANIFQVQTEIAEQVAQALNVTLLETERLALASEPTKNLQAWDYYLRGNEYFHRDFFLESDLRISIRMYDKAVELDTRFALAYAQLSRAHLLMRWMSHDLSAERLALAKQAVNKALQLNPELPEAHLALGHYYYHGHLDYERALEQFAIARKRRPNSSDLMSFIGYVQRRQGKFEKAVVTLKEASELDPRSALLACNLGETFMLLRKYSEAERYYERAISLAPDSLRFYAYKMQLYLLAEGSSKKSRTVLNRALENIGAREDDIDFIYFHWALLEIFEGNYQKALDTLSMGFSEAFETQFYFVPKAQLYGQINGLMGNRQLEQAYYESALSILKTKVQEQPEDARFHSSLGIAYAGLGRKQDAIREGKLAVDLLPVSKEAWRGTFRVEALAKIYVMVGEFDAAIEKLEYLLSIPSELTIPLLRLDPVWDPLRDHPRFKKLVEREK